MNFPWQEVQPELWSVKGPMNKCLNELNSCIYKQLCLQEQICLDNQMGLDNQMSLDEQMHLDKKMCLY